MMKMSFDGDAVRLHGSPAEIAELVTSAQALLELAKGHNPTNEPWARQVFSSDRDHVLALEIRVDVERTPEAG